MLGIVLEILRLEVLHIPSQAQADHGFFSAAVSFCVSGCGVSEESAGLKPRAAVSCSVSVSRCGSEDAARSFSSAVAGITLMASMGGVMNTFSTQTSMAAPG